MPTHKCFCPAPATASQGTVPMCPLYGRPQTSLVLLQHPRRLSPHVPSMPGHKCPLPCSCSSIQGMIPTCPLHGSPQTSPVLLLPADPCPCPPAVGQAAAPTSGTGRGCGGTLSRWDLLRLSRPHLALPQRIIPPGVHPQPGSAPGSKEGLEPPQPGRALSTGPLIPLYFLNETRARPARPGSGICHSRAALPEAPAGAEAGQSGSRGDGSSPILWCISHRCQGTPVLDPPADPPSPEPFVTSSKQEQPLNAPIKPGQLRSAMIPLGKSLIIINFYAALLLPAQ